MDFISNQNPQIQEMLQALGISDVTELFQAIPAHLRLPRPSEEDGLSESEGMRLMEKLAAKNSYPQFDNYLGAGAYEHHVSPLVGAICSKSEFLTAYTPYQAEASQGLLQITFEFQSAICALTGLDVANASLYDGASACAEAMLMALRCRNERTKVIVPDSLHPHYRAVIEQYLTSHKIKVEKNFHFDENSAAVIVQYPNFFGRIEDVKSVFAQAKAAGALCILVANPLVYGLFSSAADLGADIAVGDGQPFGLPLQYGGPYVGYMACKQELVRQMPGRIVGETVDTEGKRGFVLTLQAREQHIRREKATSNICTNQALAALACLIGITWYGKQGLPKLALTNYQRAHYLCDNLKKIKGLKEGGNEPFFNEFVMIWDRPLDKVLKHFRAHGIEPGLDLSRFYPLKNHLLVAVTEAKTKEQLDRYIRVAQECQA